MDFLDPRKRKAHRTRLFIGYFLVSIVIGLATVILVYAAYGYGINTKTGQIIQNGLLFADSKPGGADIYLNSKKLSAKTAARLTLNAGDYSLTIKKEGYRSWQRNFVLDEHTIARYVYPFLFPVKPVTTNLKTYQTQPPLVTQTPDRHWILVQSAESTGSNLIFDQFDTSALSKAPITIALPKDVPTVSDTNSFKEVEWASNNDQLLLQHIFTGGMEFIVFNRLKPEASYNVNKLFKVDPTKVTLKNKKADQLYVFSKVAATLQIADTGQGTLADPILKHVLEYKSYGNDIITYVTNQSAPAGKVQARILDTGRNYLLYTFSPGDIYLLDVAQFQGHWYYVAGSNTSGRIDIFKDPEDSIRNPIYGKAVPMVALSEPGATKLNFSDNARFIETEAGQNVAVQDLETMESYRYEVKVPLSSELKWMDGHRLIGQTGGNAFVIDYDNTNPQVVSPTLLSLGGYFSQDYNQMITLVPSETGTNVILQRVDMRAGADLPQDHTQ